MNSSAAYIVVRDTGTAYHFTGVTEITHSLSLKIFEKADTTELESFVNGAKNQPDRVTLSVVETDAMHPAGWAARMLEILYAVKRQRLLCRVVTPQRTYEDMLLSAVFAVQDETVPDGWSGELTFTEYIPLLISVEAKTDDNASTPKNTGSAAPPPKVSGAAEPVQALGKALASGIGAMTVTYVALDRGSTLQQKLARAEIHSDRVQCIM